MLKNLKKIEACILALDERPQFGLSAPFPLEEVQDYLQKLLNCPQLSLVIQEKGWDCKAPWQETGAHYFVLTLEISPLEQPVFFVMHEQNLKELMAEIFTADKKLAVFYERAMVEGFYQYLALEVLQMIAQTGFAQPLAPRLAAIQWNHVPKENLGYVCDVGCEWDGHTAWGHLFLPQSFRSQWKEYFSHHEFGCHFSPKLPLEVKIQVGSSIVNVEVLKTIRIGDVLLLDSCDYYPQQKQGFATLWVESEPIFRGRYQKDGLELEELTSEERGEVMDKEYDVEQEGSTEGADIAQLPVHLTVEAGRLTMTLKEISELSPGNLLPLSDTPELGVTLWVNNKRIGKGELVQIGEGVGVRIISF